MHILGGACVHIKAIGPTQIPHQSKNSNEGVGGHYPLRSTLAYSAGMDTSRAVSKLSLNIVTPFEDLQLTKYIDAQLSPPHHSHNNITLAATYLDDLGQK